MARYTMSKAPSWIGPVTLVALVLGFLLASAWKMPQNSPNSIYSGRPTTGAAAPAGNPIDERENEIKRLRDQLTQMQTAIADRSRQTKVLNDALQEVKLFAGLTEVTGPGLQIVLRDSKKKTEDPVLIDQYNIHDKDVLTIVNDLWMSGAEAISVNGQRLSHNANFRCEGPVIYVGRVPMSSPIKILAIGNVDTLFGALTMQGRYLDTIRRSDPAMAEVTKKDKLILPAFAGSSELTYAKSAAPKP